MNTCKHNITQAELNSALANLRTAQSKGVVMVGASTIIATKLTDDASEAVMSLYCIKCSALDTVSKDTKDDTPWIITPALALNLII
jgi:hypothetical protein